MGVSEDDSEHAEKRKRRWMALLPSNLELEAQRDNGNRRDSSREVVLSEMSETSGGQLLEEEREEREGMGIGTTNWSTIRNPIAEVTASIFHYLRVLLDWILCKFCARNFKFEIFFLVLVRLICFVDFTTLYRTLCTVSPSVYYCFFQCKICRISTNVSVISFKTYYSCWMHGQPSKKRRTEMIDWLKWDHLFIPVIVVLRIISSNSDIITRFLLCYMLSMVSGWTLRRSRTEMINELFGLLPLQWLFPPLQDTQESTRFIPLIPPSFHTSVFLPLFIKCIIPSRKTLLQKKKRKLCSHQPHHSNNSQLGMDCMTIRISRAVSSCWPKRE